MAERAVLALQRRLRYAGGCKYHPRRVTSSLVTEKGEDCGRHPPAGAEVVTDDIDIDNLFRYEWARGHRWSRRLRATGDSHGGSTQYNDSALEVARLALTTTSAQSGVFSLRSAPSWRCAGITIVSIIDDNFRQICGAIEDSVSAPDDVYLTHNAGRVVGFVGSRSR